MSLKSKRCLSRSLRPSWTFKNRSGHILPMDEELLIGAEKRLRERVQTLGDKALAVRSRLDDLLATLDAPEEMESRLVIGADGDDIDFLVADVVTLRSLIGQMRSQIEVIRRSKDPGASAMQLHVVPTDRD